MTVDPANTPIQSRYAQRLASDLAENTREQEALRNQIGDLQARLQQLAADAEWLSGVHGTVTRPGEPATPVRDETPVPKPRKAAAASPRKKSPAAAAPKKPTAVAATKKPTADAGPKKPTAVEAPKKPAAKPAKKSGEPPLHTLVLGLLTARVGEPRLAREVHTDLLAKHPERGTSVQVVRNALDALVKKGQAVKETKQGSAMYTARENAAGSPSPVQAEPSPAQAEPTPAGV